MEHSLLGIRRTYHKEAQKMGEIQGHERNVCQVPNPTTIQATASKEGSRLSPPQKQMGSVHINRQRETPSSAHPTGTGTSDQHRHGKDANHYRDRIPSLYNEIKDPTRLNLISRRERNVLHLSVGVESSPLQLWHFVMSRFNFI